MAESAPQGDDLALSRGELRRLLRINERTIDSWIRAGRLEPGEDGLAVVDDALAQRCEDGLAAESAADRTAAVDVTPAGSRPRRIRRRLVPRRLGRLPERAKPIRASAARAEVRRSELVSARPIARGRQRAKLAGAARRRVRRGPKPKPGIPSTLLEELVEHQFPLQKPKSRKPRKRRAKTDAPLEVANAQSVAREDTMTMPEPDSVPVGAASGESPRAAPRSPEPTTSGRDRVPVEAFWEEHGEEPVLSDELQDVNASIAAVQGALSDAQGVASADVAAASSMLESIGPVPEADTDVEREPEDEPEFAAIELDGWLEEEELGVVAGERAAGEAMQSALEPTDAVEPQDVEPDDVELEAAAALEQTDEAEAEAEDQDDEDEDDEDEDDEDDEDEDDEDEDDEDEDEDEDDEVGDEDEDDDEVDDDADLPAAVVPDVLSELPTTEELTELLQGIEVQPSKPPKPFRDAAMADAVSSIDESVAELLRRPAADSLQPAIDTVRSELRQSHVALAQKVDRVAGRIEAVHEQVQAASRVAVATGDAVAGIRDQVRRDSVLRRRALAARAPDAPAVPIAVALIAVTWAIAFYVKTGDWRLALGGLVFANLLGCVSLLSSHKA